MKSTEELNRLKKEIEAFGKKLSELSDEELKEVVGGKTDHLVEDVGDGADSATPGGSISTVIGDWENEAHDVR